MFLIIAGNSGVFALDLSYFYYNYQKQWSWAF